MKLLHEVRQKKRPMILKDIPVHTPTPSPRRRKETGRGGLHRRRKEKGDLEDPKLKFPNPSSGVSVEGKTVCPSSILTFDV